MYVKDLRYKDWPAAPNTFYMCLELKHAKKTKKNERKKKKTVCTCDAGFRIAVTHDAKMCIQKETRQKTTSTQ